MTADFRDLEYCLARATERSGAAASDQDLLTEKLTFSAGTRDGVTYYRPYYVAAKFIEQNRRTQQISESSGTKFTGLARTTQSLMMEQAALDQALGLTIPPGMTATTGNNRTLFPTATVSLEVQP